MNEFIDETIFTFDEDDKQDTTLDVVEEDKFDKLFDEL